MNVEIWSDIACPWCYIGKRRFESALERFEHPDQVEVQWRSFELDPAAPAVRPGGVVEHLATKYGQTPAAARAMVTNIEQVAAGEGLEFHMERTAGGNTFDAHRLLHLALERGRQDELKEALLHGYFTGGRPVADRSALTETAVGVGLDRAEVEAVLDGQDYAEAVRDDEAQAHALGISAVPFFVLDRKYGVAGAQPAELILDALRRAWTDTHPLERIGAASDTGGACDSDSCAI
jgi:predicted DsbA family dithiol-disulfide isomerase